MFLWYSFLEIIKSKYSSKYSITLGTPNVIGEVTFVYKNEFWSGFTIVLIPTNKQPSKKLISNSNIFKHNYQMSSNAETTQTTISLSEFKKLEQEKAQITDKYDQLLTQYQALMSKMKEDREKTPAKKSSTKKKGTRKKSAYSFFISETFKNVKSENPEFSLAEIRAEVGTLWKKIKETPDDFAEWQQKADTYNEENPPTSSSDNGDGDSSSDVSKPKKKRGRSGYAHYVSMMRS